MSRHGPATLALLLLLSSPLSAAPPAPDQALQGVLTLVWVDAAPDRHTPEDVQYWLNERGGGRTRLEVPPALRSAVHRLDRRAVRVRGRPLPPQAAAAHAAPPAPAFALAAIEAAPPAAAGAGGPQGAFEWGGPVLGKQRWINLLCKFSDISMEQREPAYFATLFSSTRPGLDYYFKEISGGQMNVADSAYTAWRSLPQAHAWYVSAAGANLGQLMEDCLALHDAEVHFPDFAGVNLIFNASLGCCSWGGGAFLGRDGVDRIYGMTWIADWGWTNHTLMAHEMGHGFGLMHSRGNNQTYRNRWDVMSDIWVNCHLATDPLIGCLAQHVIGHHKHRLGWVPESGLYVAPPGSSRQLALDKLERPAAGSVHLARIPIRGSPTHFYTVEARRKYGYDVRLPGASIVIHEVDTALPESANVVDGDDNGDPYDDGTRWLVGETFEDAATGIRVSVDAADGAGFLVTIHNPDNVIFEDGFESGDLSAWSGKFDGGDVSAFNGFPIEGAWVMKLAIDDNNQAHVTDHTPQGETSYRARFRFHPGTLAMAAGERFTIFGAYTDTAYAAMVEIRRNAGSYELRALARQDDGSAAASNWIFVSHDFAHEVVLDWQASSAPGVNDGQMRFYIDESPFADFTALDNDTVRVERALMGAVTGVDGGTRGTVYFDGFRSAR